ncbi:MAG: putative glycoside hydrolase [bacterium]
MNRSLIILFLTILTVAVLFLFFPRIFVKNTDLNRNSVEEEITLLLVAKNLPENKEEVLEIITPPILVNPPEIIKSIYLTSWSASSEKRIDYVIELASSTGINAVVIDIKDYSGNVFYDTAVPEAEEYKAEIKRIADIDSLIERLHQEGIYVIARVTVFQDPVLALARPDLAIKSQADDSLPWLDNKGLAWIDVSAKDAWDYNIAIAQDAARHGFDEINFDYVRFPSDGDLKDMVFPFYDEETLMRTALSDFFAYLRQGLPDIKTSVDLFGLVTVRSDDMGIGQVLEDTFPYFNFICPMVYPSHYDDWFLGYPNPAEYPYEVVKYSMENALKRWELSTTTDKGELRPWLQDFDMGADYDAAMVRKEIKAVADVMGDNYKGFMLWSPTNFYTEEAIGR